MTKIEGRYTQVTPVKAVKKPVQRKTPLSQPGSKGFSQQTMENSKPFYSGTGGKL